MCVCRICMANQLHMLKTSAKEWEGLRKVSRIKVAECEIEAGRKLKRVIGARRRQPRSRG